MRGREQQRQQQCAGPADEIRCVNPGLFKEDPRHQAGTPPKPILIMLKRAWPVERNWGGMVASR